MKVNAICFTENGYKLIKRLIQADTELKICSYCKGDFEHNGKTYQGSVYEFAKECFDANIPLLVVGATGIAVRMIAPCIKDKLQDIPVVVVDELGSFTIPLLSGHVGGAQELAKIISGALESICVTTTATDINEAFSIDSFAVENRLTIQNKDCIKKVSGKILQGKPIKISIKEYPPSEAVDVIIADKEDWEFAKASDETSNKSSDKANDKMNEKSGTETLYLTRKRYVLGIGCKRGKSLDELDEFITKCLLEHQLSWSDIYAFGSIEIKTDEDGLNALSALHRVPFVTFDTKQLENVDGIFEESDFVKSQVGIGNVCERAAVLLAGKTAKLIMGKRAENGMTLAIAARY